MRKTLNVSFDGSKGSPLAARLDLPEQPRAFALFAHCFTCTKDFLAPSRVSRLLADSGLAVLRFDFTGLGESEGDFAQTSLSTNIEDVKNAAAFLAEEYQSPKILIGHSLGGVATLCAAPSIPSAGLVATIATPSSAAALSSLVAPAMEEINTCGEAEVLVGGRPFRIGKGFVDDLHQHPLAETIKQLHAAVYVFHGPDDATVPVSAAEQILAACSYPKSLISLEGADHLLSKKQDAQFVAQNIVAWAERHLPQQ